MSAKNTTPALGGATQDKKMTLDELSSPRDKLNMHQKNILSQPPQIPIDPQREYRGHLQLEKPAKSDGHSSQDGISLNELQTSLANTLGITDAEPEPEQSSTEPSWAMFEKIKELGMGSFGVVYLVKCMQNSLIRTDGAYSQATNSTQASAEKGGTISKLKAPRKGSTVNSSMVSGAGALTTSTSSTGSFLSNAAAITGPTLPTGVQTRSMAAIQKQRIARELLKDQLYVIKVIETEKFPQEIGVAMMEEIELIRSLDSPYIVGYIDSFIDSDLSINIILEFCPGGDLQTYMAKQAAAAINTKKSAMNLFHDNFIWKLFIQICLGLHYLHSQKGILHRDMKALNIFLTKDNDAKIGDFGAAQRIKDSTPVGQLKQGDTKGFEPLSSIKEEIFRENSVGISGGKPEDTMLFSLSASNTLKRDYKNQKVGTPFYLAPELWLTETNNLCSKQSDIWSLGVILYELCTQKKPFQAQDKHTLSQKVLKEKYAPIPMSVNQNFTELIAKCLQKKPEKRPLIDEIIQNEIFQQKAKQLKIKLPVITTAASGGTDLKASQNDQKGQIAAKSSIAKDLKRSSIIEEPIVELKKAQSSGVKATQVQPQEGGLKPLEALGSKKSSESEPSVISQGRPSLKPLATKTITKSRDESPNQLKSGNKSERKLTSTPLGHHQRQEQSQLIEEIEDMRNHASSTLEIERPQHLIAASNSPPLKRTIFGAREKAQAGIFSIEKQGLAEKTDKPIGRLSHLNMRHNQPSEEKTADEAHPFPIVQSTPTHMHGSQQKQDTQFPSSSTKKEPPLKPAQTTRSQGKSFILTTTSSTQVKPSGISSGIRKKETIVGESNMSALATVTEGNQFQDTIQKKVTQIKQSIAKEEKKVGSRKGSDVTHILESNQKRLGVPPNVGRPKGGRGSILGTLNPLIEDVDRQSPLNSTRVNESAPLKKQQTYLPKDKKEAGPGFLKKQQTQVQQHQLIKDMSQKSLASVASQRTDRSTALKPGQSKVAITKAKGKVEDNVYGPMGEPFSIAHSSTSNLLNVDGTSDYLNHKKHNRVNTNTNMPSTSSRLDPGSSASKRQSQIPDSITSQTYKGNQKSNQSSKNPATQSQIISSSTLTAAKRQKTLKNSTLSMKEAIIAAQKEREAKKFHKDFIPEDEGMEFDDEVVVNEKLLTEHENELDDMLLTEENIMIDDDDDHAFYMHSGENTPNDDEERDFTCKDRIIQEMEQDCTSVHLPPADDSEFKEEEDVEVTHTTGRQIKNTKINLGTPFKVEDFIISREEGAAVFGKQNFNSRNSRKFTDGEDKRFFATSDGLVTPQQSKTQSGFKGKNK